MPYKFKVTPKAVLDLQIGIEYYDLKERGLGRRFEQEIILFFEKIKEAPFSSSFAYSNVRYKVVSRFPYNIIYTIFESEIRILRVFNTYQKPFR